MTRKTAELYTISEPEAPAPADPILIRVVPPLRERSWRDLMRRLENRLLPRTPHR